MAQRRETPPRQEMTRRALLRGAAAGGLCAAAGGAWARPLEEVMERGPLRIAVYKDFFPFSFHRDGALVGIDVDLAKALAEKLALPLALQEQPPGEKVNDDLRVQIWRGSLFGGERADIMMHIPYNKPFMLQNPECALFGPYHREIFAWARNTELAPGGELTDLPEAPIGVEFNSVPAIYFTSAQAGRLRSSVKHFSSAEDAAEALMTGDVVAAFGPISELSARLGDQAEKFKLKPAQFGPGFPSVWDLGMAVRENSRDLANATTDALTALIDDGTVDRIFARYGAQRRPIPIED